MVVAILALSAAFFSGLGHVLSKQGVGQLPATSFLTLRIFWAIILLTLWLIPAGTITSITLSPVIIFPILGGIFGPLMAWNFYLHALEHLDVSLAQPISSLWLLVTVVLGITVLGEQTNALALLGTLLVIGGMYFLFPRTSSTTLAGQPDGISARGLLFLGGSILFWGLNGINFKLAVTYFSPYQVNWIRLLVSGSVLVPYTSFRLLTSMRAQGARKITTSWRRSLWTAFLAALATDLIGISLQFSALQLGQAVTVWPLFGSSPLFVALLSTLLLREQVGFQRLLGIICTTIGVILVAGFGTR